MNICRLCYIRTKRTSLRTRWVMVVSQSNLVPIGNRFRHIILLRTFNQ
nr:MAG TPA: hypothetical protein [Caudoviricetes sp.]DAO57038.1 MAG TPA: hypothetical protein [Caudoviricetes sp.]DAY12310.1 MAG TPA: hypothetical protein [Caudoviricetes sp.]